MAVDKIELTKDLETPEYQALVKEVLSKKEFVIRTKEEETTFQANFKTDVIEKEIPSKIRAVHDQYDKDVEEITGLKREQNEKSYEFVKRALKHNTGDAAALKTEIADLKKQIKEGDRTGATAQALKEAEEKYKTSLAEKEEIIKSLQTETSQTKKSALLTSDYAGIKSRFVKTLPPMFDRTEKVILSEALALGVVGQDGKLYLSDGNGGIKKDNAFNPIPMAKYLEEEFKGVMEAAPKGGAGSGGGADPNATDPNAITADNFIVPETVKNGGDLMEYMLSIGLKRGTDQYNKIWEKHRMGLADATGIKARPAPPKK
jgi:Seryl-tRNA synthetase